MGVSRLHDQRDLAQAARVYLHRRSLGVSFTRWRRRVDIESCLELTVQRFQVGHMDYDSCSCRYKLAQRDLCALGDNMEIKCAIGELHR